MPKIIIKNCAPCYNGSMTRIRVGVLRGGPSSEHAVSLKTGNNVLRRLEDFMSDKYQARDILITKDGQWHFNHLPVEPEKVFRNVDVIFNCLHGRYGEDGKVQQLFESFNIPYTGSGILASALGMNKIMSRDIFKKAEIRVPNAIILEENNNLENTASDIAVTMPRPWVVKPASSGSSVGVSIVDTPGALIKAVIGARNHSSKVMIEEHIEGREVTCGIIENFRGSEHYSLPVIEIIPPEHREFFDYDAKYSGQTREICPASFPKDVKDEIERLAILAHRALGCRHYSRSDFIVAKNRIYILEINTLPGLTKESLLPKSLEAIGCDYSDFLDHLISLALRGRHPNI